MAVVAAGFALFIGLYFAFRLRRVGSQVSESDWNLVDRPEQVLFFVPLLMITILLAIAEKVGADFSDDPHLEALSEETLPEKLVEQIEAQKE